MVSAECLDKLHERCEGCPDCSCHRADNHHLVCGVCGTDWWMRVDSKASDRCPRCRSKVQMPERMDLDDKEARKLARERMEPGQGAGHL